MSIVEEYFGYHKLYTAKFGPKAVVFLQVGMFYEAYQTEQNGHDLVKIAEVINVTPTRKNKSIQEISNSNPALVGFPVIALAKYTKILTDHNYRAVVYNQTETHPIRRELYQIYSPGTYLEEEINNSETKYILSIYLEEVNNNKSFICGIVLGNIVSNNTLVHETYSLSNDKSIPTAEILKFVKGYNIAETIIVTCNVTSYKKRDLICFLELKNVHYYTLEEYIAYQKCPDLIKPSYQQTIFKKIYKGQDIDIDSLTHARIALTIYLLYVDEHNSKLLCNVNVPELYKLEKFLNLTDTAAEQLNIFNGQDDKSLFDIINFTNTSMGKRTLKSRLSNPIVDVAILNERYDLIEFFSKKPETTKMMSRTFSYLMDFEKVFKKINLQKINPIEIYRWIRGLISLNLMFSKLSSRMFEDDDFINIFPDQFLNLNEKTERISLDLKYMCRYLESIFHIEELDKYLLDNIHDRIFKPKLNIQVFKEDFQNSYNARNDELTKILDEKIICDSFMRGLQEYFIDVLCMLGVKRTKTDLVNIAHTDRDKYHFTLSSKRAELLERFLRVNTSINIDSKIIEYNQLTFKYGTSTCKLLLSGIQQTTKDIETIIANILEKSRALFLEVMKTLIDQYKNLFTDLTGLISDLDVILSCAKCASEYSYNKPVIQINTDDSLKSYVCATQLRNPIVERILETTKYVPNDVTLGKDGTDGILLFGLNSAGKSCFMKSIAQNIIIAQIGCYVAAETFTFYPYCGIIPRISGGDNVYRRMSSFEIEIADLRAILKRSNKNTLIIADEVCKGTENASAQIIVMAMLDIISRKGSSFITATHLHELQKTSIMNITNIKPYHIHIEYNEAMNTMKYDRILKKGCGDSFYGLDVAKYLIDDEEFKTVANKYLKTAGIAINPNKKRKISKILRMDVWNSYIGIKYGEITCPYCNTNKISQLSFECGHIIAESKGGETTIGNLRPICNVCNKSLGTNNLDTNKWEKNRRLD